MVRKRNKATKGGQTQEQHSLAPSAAESEQLIADLLAELDTRNQLAQQETSVIPQAQNGLMEHYRTHVSKARKAAALAQSMPTADSAADAQVEWETKQEAALINRTCDELGVQIHEINPDGHCLFSAIADQLALLNILPSSQANYATDGVGATADSGIMTATQFERYCLLIRDTGAWGGEPEILALSKVYGVPILVIQGGNPPIVVHDPSDTLVDPKDRHLKAARISFHRRKYGLGEHYNSLRPKHTLATVTDKIQSIFS
ncbi:OTU-domain-containing protein [Pisolithus orientalis]|uniref:OTU-domain-containing protein n=1 Tax=Pisolithus orientalis TaxID=936130 RepID=UPI00222594D2|nr:OTU-domain-containing protein [Pisolithus orientalis]KAI6028362.1 OTU-domain-containing protein [Pisolithus orientalis]